MAAKKVSQEKKLLKKFEVSAAHLGKCFGVISSIFGDIYGGSCKSDDNLQLAEKLERSARFFNNRNKRERFYKVPPFFYFVRSKLKEIKTLDFDFKKFEEASRVEWKSLGVAERMRVTKSAERLKRLRQKVNGFELFSDPDLAERRNVEQK